MVQVKIEDTATGLSVYEVLCSSEHSLRGEKVSNGYEVYFGSKEEAEKAISLVSDYKAMLSVTEFTPDESKVMERKRIGGLMKKAFEENNVTFKEVGERSGIDRTVISRTVNGMYSTGIDMMSQIMAAVGKQIVFDDLKPSVKRCGTCAHYVTDEFGEMVCDIRVGRYKFVEPDQSCERHIKKD